VKTEKGESAGSLASWRKRRTRVLLRDEEEDKKIPTPTPGKKVTSSKEKCPNRRM